MPSPLSCTLSSLPTLVAAFLSREEELERAGPHSSRRSVGGGGGGLVVASSSSSADIFGKISFRLNGRWENEEGGKSQNGTTSSSSSFGGFPQSPFPSSFSIFGISHTKRLRALSLSFPDLILTRKRYLGFFKKLWRDIQLQDGQQTHKIPTESSCTLCSKRAAQHNNPFAAAVAAQKGRKCKSKMRA